MSYKAPLEDMNFLINQVFNIDQQLSDIPAFSDFDQSLYAAILEESAKFSENVLYPLNRTGDEQGCQFKDGEVTTPSGFKDAYKAYGDGGWQGVSGDPEYGGQGLPKTINLLTEEMVYSSNTSFCLYSSLTNGAYQAIRAHASDAVKALFLPPMLEGRWTGAMGLTEPHAGSDLGIIRSKAEPLESGKYLINGTKIFITGGDQDLTENIIHLVLAKLPDAPEGPKGISLFLVPKINVLEDGSLGQSNGVSCGSIEHKMGIKHHQPV
ncbi:MAG: acyl-CoA dehydrogenase family protein [Enterobacterales bacterium]|nr:acyl-CoA dehydrogenase family protein [Enterobacterales bacterium]